MKKILVILGIVLSLQAFARGGSFGGARSSFGGARSSSYSSGRSSSFGGARSTNNATIIRPSESTSSGARSSTTVINNNSGGGYYGNGGGGFWSGFLWGNLMSQPRAVVVNGAGYVNGAGQPVVVQQGWSFFGVLFWVIIIGLLAWFIFSLVVA